MSSCWRTYSAESSPASITPGRDKQVGQIDAHTGLLSEPGLEQGL